MTRALGTVAVLIVVCLAAPALSRAAQAAVPTLLTLLVVLLCWRTAFPSSRRR